MIQSDEIENTNWDFDEVERTIEQNSNEQQNIRNEVISHFSQYRDAMISQANPNTPSRRIDVGDYVIIKIDFDNNQANRRMPLDGFFEEDKYVVVEVLTNNMFKLKNIETNEEISVFKTRLKKILN